MYLYIHMYTYIYIYIYTHIHTYISIEIVTNCSILALSIVRERVKWMNVYSIDKF